MLISLGMILKSSNLGVAAWRLLRSPTPEDSGFSVNPSGADRASVVSSRSGFKGLDGASGELEVLESVCSVGDFCEPGVRAHSNSCGNTCFVRLGEVH